jgi:hypothetical protein
MHIGMYLLGFCSQKLMLTLAYVKFMLSIDRSLVECKQYEKRIRCKYNLGYLFEIFNLTPAFRDCLDCKLELLIRLFPDLDSIKAKQNVGICRHLNVCYSGLWLTDL